MYLIQPPIEIPGWGQIHANVIEDAATHAEYWLEKDNLSAALHYRQELEGMILQKTWRSQAAADVLLRIQRAYLARFALPENEPVFAIEI